MTIELFNMNCIDYLKDCEDNAFDLAIVDPPYFDGPNCSGYYGKGWSSIGIARSTYHGEVKSWEVPGPEYFEQLKRVAKNQIIWGANHFAGVFNSSSPCWITWDKVNGESTFSDLELAYTSFNRGAVLLRYMWNGMLQGKSLHDGHIAQGNKKLNEKRIHPTQKPVIIYSWQLDKFAKPGQRILDTHLGSGSSAIAAHYFGVDFVGIELDPDYFNAAKERIDQATRQVAMF